MRDAILVAGVLLAHGGLLGAAWARRDRFRRSTDLMDKTLLALLYTLTAIVSFFALFASLEYNAISVVSVHPNVLTAADASAIAAMAEAEAARRGQWSTARHKWYPTTDLNCYDIEEPLQPTFGESERFGSWWNRTMEPQVFALLAQTFAVPIDSLYMKDLFVVKYDMKGQKYLPEHQDSSRLTFNIALSEPGSDFSGGGSRFVLSGRTVLNAKGSMLLHESGLFHAGKEITSGTRSFGGVASCISDQSVGDAGSVSCRRWAWMIWYVLHRPFVSTYNVMMRGKASLDTAGGVPTDATSDIIFTFFMAVLFLLFFIVFALLLSMYCCADFCMNHFGPVMVVRVHEDGTDKLL